MSGLSNWRTKRRHSGVGGRSGSAFGPIVARRSAASAVESPLVCSRVEGKMAHCGLDAPFPARAAADQRPQKPLRKQCRPQLRSTPASFEKMSTTHVPRCQPLWRASDGCKLTRLTAEDWKRHQRRLQTAGRAKLRRLPTTRTRRCSNYLAAAVAVAVSLAVRYSSATHLA